MSTTAKATMIEKMVGYFTKVASNIRPLVFDIDIQLAPNAKKIYDLKTLISDNTLYELRSAKVTVQVLNTEAGSALINTYVNAEAVAAVGITAAGIVTVLNTDVNTNKYIIRIDKPAVRK